MYVGGKMLRKGAAIYFLMTPGHFYLTTAVDSQLLLKPHQRQTASTGKSYMKNKGEIYKTHTSASFGSLYSHAREENYKTRFP